MRDAGVLTISLPQSRRQVPQDIFAASRAVAGLRFGVELGLGFRTYLTTTSPYFLVIALWLAAPPFIVAVFAGCGFGLGRALMLWSRYLKEDFAHWDRTLERYSRLIVLVPSILAVPLSCFILTGLN